MTNDERNQIEVLRAEVNGKLDILLERTVNLSTDIDDHERRLRSVEKWKAAIPASLVVAIFAAAGWLVRMWTG